MISHNARNPRGRQRAAVSALALALSLGSFATSALAQDAEDGEGQAADATPSDDIVVTGTLIRGVRPTGSDLISVGSESLKAQGIANSAQILSVVPQFQDFNQLKFPTASGNVVTSIRPMLRAIPGGNTFAGSSTLVLADGHRLVGMGINSTTPDVDVIPPSILERLEILPDGGSAAYGSDAVAGVMNFNTRRKMDGISTNARVGLAADYTSFDADITVGTSWTGGSALITYSYQQNDGVFGRDRDYYRQQRADLTGLSTPVISLSCSPGNILAGGQVYPIPASGGALTPSLSNQCDNTDDTQFFPWQRRHSVFFAGQQELSDNLTFDVTAYYYNRQQRIAGGPIRGSQNNVTASNPFFAPYAAAGASQQVFFVYGGPEANLDRLSLESWGITPRFTYKLGGDWRLSVLGNYGWSKTTIHHRNGFGVNGAAFNNALNNGLFNPYNPGESNADALRIILNNEVFGRARQELFNARAIADGSLFALPAGNVKLAVGVEYIYETYRSQKSNGIVPGTENTGAAAQFVNGILIAPAQAATPIFNLSRNNKAVFGELNVPLFGAENGFALMRELNLSASVRYDSYNDVGSTLNPRFGITYKPVDWLTIRSAWGTSFTAPSLAQAPASAPTSVNYGNAAIPPAGLGYTNPTVGQQTISISGVGPQRPQKAKTWSIGGDIRVPFVDGLSFGITYYRINITDRIGAPPFSNASLYYSSYRNLITINPSAQQIANAVAGAQVTGTPCTNGCTIYSILDQRTSNLGDYLTDGIDLSANYRRDTGFGSIDLSANATHLMNGWESQFPGGPKVVNNLSNLSTWKFAISAGATVGKLRAQATWNHSQGYDLTLPVGPVNEPRQFSVGSFNVVNLFFRYDLDDDSMFRKDMAVTLNVNNVFNQSPPFSLSSPGFTNGSTLGREFQIGLSKKF